MTKIKKEFVVEFTLFGNRISTTILAENEAQATERLFADIRAETKIEFIVAPNNKWNEAMEKAGKVLNTLGRFSKPS